MADFSSAVPAPNFDPLAKLYRWMEYASFGPMLECCRFLYLPECGNARRALVLGDGDGRFTTRLMASNPKITVDAVDASPAMLRELRQRVMRTVPEATSRLNTFHADARNFTFPCTDYDLIVTHFFVDCLTEGEVAALAARILPHLTQDARWLISEFAIPPQRSRKLASQLIVRLLYIAFRWMTHLTVQRIPDYARILYHSGFRIEKQHPFLGGLLQSELWGRESA